LTIAAPICLDVPPNDMKTLMLFVLGCCLSLRSVVAQQTTAFTYQGQLRDGGMNANGTYAMTFKLFTSSSGGTQIGGTIAGNQNLVNGLFTVNLDFGSGAFTGAARWMEINVAGDTLSPRVQVLPAPYAAFATIAGDVTNHAIGNLQLATNAIATTNIQGNAITSELIATNAVTTNHIGSGQVVKDINGFKDSVTLSAGANVYFHSSGNGLVVNATPPPVPAYVFLTNGTFVIASNSPARPVTVEMWGGGGGGGGGFSLHNGTDNIESSGGGGGAGGYAKNTFMLSPGSYTVTVGTSGNPGFPGTASSFGGLISAGGGGAGGNGTAAGGGTGGSGGTSSGGFANFHGKNGQNGYGNSGLGGFTGGNGASAYRGGVGGWGNSNGENGEGPGAGGGGVPAGFTPGEGGGGVVFIYL
jgi:hypothetical protein